jgi:hypothetical protein
MPSGGRSDFPDQPGEDGPFPIAAVGGAPGSVVQRVLAEFAARRAREGFRVAGVIEEADPDGSACGAVMLCDLAGTVRVPITQNLGAGSTACNLDPSGLAAGCAAVQQAIAEGADLVVLSKFGKIEAERHGLTEAFQAAIAADLPVVTSVAPPLAAAWAAFAGALSVRLAADADALDAWWATQAPARARSTTQPIAPAHQR